MDFYKILFQSIKGVPFYKQISLTDSCLIGSSSYSFAVKYSPESYNTWLLNDKVFEIYLKNSVKQLIMTNFKFLHLLNQRDNLHLKLIDYSFKGEKPGFHTLSSVMKNEENQISQVRFISRDKNMITLKSNGVLQIEKELSEGEMVDIKKIIDFLSFGPAILDQNNSLFIL